MSNPRIGQAKMMCSMWHLLTFHDVSSGVVCFLFPRPPRLHCFEFDLNDGKLLGRRQMPLEDQWLGAFLCCKLHMGGLRRILLNPQLRQRGWILSPATSYKKFATLHLKRYGSCHRIFTLIRCRWYGCSGWYANLPSSPRWERGWFLFFFFPPWLQCCCMLIVVKTTHKNPPLPWLPTGQLPASGKVLLLLWCLETWGLVSFSILIEGRSWKRHCDQLGCWWWDSSLAPYEPCEPCCWWEFVEVVLMTWPWMVFLESCIIFWGVLCQNLSFSRTVLVVRSGWGKNMRMMVGLSDAW